MVGDEPRFERGQTGHPGQEAVDPTALRRDEHSPVVTAPQLPGTGRARPQDGVDVAVEVVADQARLIGAVTGVDRRARRAHP